MGEQVRWEGTGTKPAEYIFFYRKGNENHELGTGFSVVYKRIISEIKRVEFVSHRMSYIILRGRGCHIIVLNIDGPTQYTIDDVKDNLYEELERVFDKFPKCHMKIMLGDFSAKVGREDIFKPAIWNESLHKLVMIMELE
jgi:hypothetical protein